MLRCSFYDEKINLAQNFMNLLLSYFLEAFNFRDGFFSKHYRA
jgi:hypothetical protein